MGWTLIIVCIFVGMTLLALEIVALPGFLCGLCGIAVAGVGIWQSYINHGTTAGIITLCAAIALGIIELVVLMKTQTWKRFSLNEKSDSRANTHNNSDIVIGAVGKSISRLAPSGKALFDNTIVEVHSFDGSFIEENTPVQIIEMEGYKIKVKINK